MTIAQKFRIRIRRSRFGRWLIGPPLSEEEKLVKAALRSADEAQLSVALDGTLSDTRSLVASTLRQAERFGDLTTALRTGGTPREQGLQWADSQLLLHAAADAVATLKLLEKVRRRIDPKAPNLPPDEEMRRRIRQARNILAAHREDRVLYKRLSGGQHTPRAVDAWRDHGVEISEQGIDIVRYHPDGSVTMGDILSLTDLIRQFEELDEALEELYRNL